MSVSDEHAARARAAEALRRLSHSLVSHQVDDPLLGRIAASATVLADEVDAGARRIRTPELSRQFYEPPSGQAPEHEKSLFRDSFISGNLNPMSFGASLWREGDEAVMEVVLGPALEGAPGRSHGGVLAAMIDETMGLVLSIIGESAFTGRLSVTYRAATPIGVPIRCRARLVEQRGRKLTMTAEVRADDQLLVQGEGLFITVDPSHFTRPPETGSGGMEPDPVTLDQG